MSDALTIDFSNLLARERFAVVPWTLEAGYLERARRPSRGDATVLTPATTVDAIRAGYEVQVAP